MKPYRKILVLALAVVCAITVSGLPVFAEGDSHPTDGASASTSASESASSNDAATANNEQSSASTVQDSGAAQQGQQSQGIDNNTTNNTGNGSIGYGDYSQPTTNQVVDRDNDFYQPGSKSADSTQPIVDNKLYDSSIQNDSKEMNADDWKLALKLDGADDSGDDFSFIKNNTSKEDSLLYTLMLFVGILFIVAAVFGIVLIIVLTVRANKRKKVALASADSKDSELDLYGDDYDGLHRGELGQDGEDRDISKYDTAEIDLSKYDKYL